MNHNAFTVILKVFRRALLRCPTKAKPQLGQVPTCQGRGKQLLVRCVRREDGLVMVATSPAPQHQLVVFHSQKVGPVVGRDTHQGTHHSFLASNLKTRKGWKIGVKSEKIPVIGEEFCLRT